MAKTFVSGTALPASDLNTNMVQPGTAGSGTRIVSGKTSYSISATNAVAVTVTYGFTFSATPVFVATAVSGSNIPLLAYMNGGNTTTTATVRVENTAGTSVTISGTVNWIAIGPP